MTITALAVGLLVAAAPDAGRPERARAAPPDAGARATPDAGTLDAQAVETFLAYVSWVFDTALTQAQVDEAQQLVQRVFAEQRAAEISVVQDAVHAGKDLVNYSETDKRDLRASVQDEYVKILRRRGPQEVSRWLLGVHQAKAQVIAPGEPKVTRQAAEATAELLAFVLSQTGTSDAVTADRAFREGVAKVLAGDRKGYGLEEQAGLAGITFDWAKLRAAWGTFPEARKQLLREEWRALLGATGVDAGAQKRPAWQPQAKEVRELLKAVLARASTWAG